MSNPSFFKHETASIDEPCSIGAGTKIWHYAHVMAHARIGRDAVLGQNVFVGAGVTIGDRVRIQNNVSVYEGVTLEDEVFCGPSVVFTNVRHPRSAIPRKHELEHTLIRRGATLGTNCTIFCGVTIGEYAFVGAGTVVTCDVPDYALVFGAPARLQGWMCACGHRLPGGFELACVTCGRRYHSDGTTTRPV